MAETLLENIDTSKVVDAEINQDQVSVLADHWQQNWSSYSEDQKTDIFEFMSKRNHKMTPEAKGSWTEFIVGTPKESVGPSGGYSNKIEDATMAFKKLKYPPTEKALEAKGRAYAEEFIKDPDQYLQFIKNENPDIIPESLHWRNNRLYGRREGEDFQRVLDPDETNTTLSEFVRDIGDEGYKIAETLGPMIAARYGGPVGAGAAAYGLEAGRQHYEGTDDDMSKIMNALLGGFTALSPGALRSMKKFGQAARDKPRQFGKQIANIYGQTKAGPVGGAAASSAFDVVVDAAKAARAGKEAGRGVGKKATSVLSEEDLAKQELKNLSSQMRNRSPYNDSPVNPKPPEAEFGTWTKPRQGVLQSPSSSDSPWMVLMPAAHWTRSNLSDEDRRPAGSSVSPRMR